MKISRQHSLTLGVSFIWLLLCSDLISAPRPPQPPWPQPTLRIYGFDTSYRPLPWDDVALFEAEAALAESWSGYALVRDGFTTAPVVVPMEADSKQPNFAPGSGAIRFWISTSWSTANEKGGGSGPGHWARLLEQVSLRGKRPEVKWSLYVNDTGDTIYLSGAGGAGARDFLQAPVQFAAGDWRLITLCYSPTNTQLQIDNQIVAKGEGLPSPAWWETNALGLVIGSDLAASPESLAGAQFEELTTLARWPRKSDWQELYYLSGKRRSLLGPLESREAEQAKVTALKAAGWLPEDYGQGKSGELDGPLEADSYAPDSLWLEITGVTNNLAHLIVHGTVTEVAYEILSKENLTNVEWAGEHVLIGAEGQDWTPTTVVVGARTNELYFWARTLADTDGDGLPDWWELAHGLDPNNPDTGATGVSDGYKDGDNDGWNNLQEYQNGTNPGSFNTPAAPQNFIAKLATGGSTVGLSWNSAPGPVTGYVITRADPPNYTPAQIAQVSAVSTAFTDTGSFIVGEPDDIYGTSIPECEDLNSEYTISATYVGGPSDTARARIDSGRSGFSVDARLIRNASGRWQLVCSAVPASVKTLRLLWQEWDYFNDWNSQTTYEDVYTTNLAGGVYVISDTESVQRLGNVLWVQGLGPNGERGVPVNAGILSADAPYFVDGRLHLKENLSFLVRAAGIFEQFYSDPDWSVFGNIDWFSSGSNHVVSGFIHRARESKSYGNYITDNDTFRPFVALNNLWPFQANYYLRNFLFDPTNSGSFQFDWQTNFTTVPAPPVLSPGGSYLIEEYDYGFGVFGFGSLDNVGVSLSNGGQTFSLQNNVHNLFGLAELEGVGLDADGQYFQVAPGGSATLDTVPLDAYYGEFASPDFSIAGYYFAPVISPGSHLINYSTVAQDQPYPLPLNSNFAVTNQTTLIIASANKSILIGGWAKLAVTNGYSGVYGYLGQYFDKAYRMTNGVVTTNETGILSPYGEFFPTEPGMTALVTMPDLDTGARGTATVYVVSMNLDANHDGTMDRTFTGPDSTSANRPFRFWVNNDYDRGHNVDCNLLGQNCDFEEDDLKPGAEGFTLSSVPDWQYTDPVTGQKAIPCKRDLEDYAPIHFAGVSELMANLPTGYTITLSWRDPCTAPGINIFRAVDPYGGIACQTNTVTANDQISTNGFCIGSVSSFQTIDLTQKYAENAGNPNRRLNDYFIFCGSTTGSGESVLQVKNASGDPVGETSAFIEIKDIKEFYERWTCGEIFSSGSSYNIGPMPTWQRENVLLASDYTDDYILYVHGWNMAPWEKERFAETAFKRLYWQGYKGRFGLFKWPTYFQSGSLFKDVVFDAANYDRSEFNAWRSATPLNNLLNYLHEHYPDRVRVIAHSMGNVVASEALKLAGTSALVHTYVASQAAIPAHCYDPNPAFNMTFEVTFDDQTPNAYAQYWTPTSPQYFFNIGGAANFVNYYNTNDWALSPTLWELNQKLKPDDTTGGYGYNVTSNLFFRGATVLTFPANTYEIFAFCDESRSRALGRQPNVGGAFTVAAQIDLNAAPYAFGTPHKGHSAQFRSYNASRWVYWDQLLSTFNIPR